MRHLDEAYDYLLKKSADQSHIARVKTKYEKFKRMRDEVLSRQSQLENKFKKMGAPQVWMKIFKYDIILIFIQYVTIFSQPILEMKMFMFSVIPQHKYVCNIFWMNLN